MIKNKRSLILSNSFALLSDVYCKFKGEKRTSDQITKLIEILQEVSDLEDYKKMLEDKIGNYERQYRGLI